MGLPRAATNLEQRRLGQRHLGQRRLRQRRLRQRRLGQRRLRQRRKKPNPLVVPKGNPLMSKLVTPSRATAGMRPVRMSTVSSRTSSSGSVVWWRPPW